MTIRHTMLGAILAAPTVTILAIIGWSGLGVVTLLLMLAMVRQHMVRSSTNGLVRLRGDVDGLCCGGNPSSAGGGHAGVGVSMLTPEDTNDMITEAIQREHERTGNVRVLARQMGCERFLRPMAEIEMMRRERDEIEAKHKRWP